MASTAAFMEYIDDDGSPDAGLDLTSKVVYWMSADVHSSIENGNGNPVGIPTSGSAYSYEKWLKVDFGGTFTQLSNMRIWKSGGTFNTGWSLKINDDGGGIDQSSWVAPVNTQSSKATADIATTEGTAHDVKAADGASATISSPGDTAYIVTQAVVQSTASPGNMITGNLSLTFQWDEQ